MNAEEAVNIFIEEGRKEGRWQSGSEPGAKFIISDMETVFNRGLKEIENDPRLLMHNMTLGMIRAMGVPETRSKSLASAFTTLIDRMDKEIHFLNAEVKRLKLK